MQTVSTFSDLKELLWPELSGTVFRITNRDITAGLGLHELFENYAIVTVHETAEMEQARQLQPVFSLEQALKKNLERTHEVGEKDPLCYEEIIKRMETMPGPERYILPYILREGSQQKLPREHWHLCAMPPRDRLFLDQRGNFMELTAEAGVKIPPCILLSQPTPEDIRSFYFKHGPCVLQDLHEAAGMGTDFVLNQDKLNQVTAISMSTPRMISKFIDGIDVSCTGCVMGSQVLTSPVRYNIVGCSQLSPKKAQYCGNDWNIDLPQKAVEELQKYTARLGAVLTKRGYRGIFGIDAIWEQEEECIYAIELNPRLLGTSQLYAVQQMEINQPPLLGCHVLSFLDINCFIPVETALQIMNEPLNGAHLIIRNKAKQTMQVKGTVKPGIYTIKDNMVQFSRTGITFGNLKSADEYLVTMVPFPNRQIGPGAQLIRIQGRTSCYNGHTKELFPQSALMVRYLENQLNLQPV